MQEKRRHKRYTLDLMQINGKMVLADRIEIMDISAGGLAMKTDRHLKVGSEYVIRLGNKKKNIDVRGRIIRCELSTIETRSDGEGVSIYTAAMMFKGLPPETITEFINSSGQVREEIPPPGANRRLHVRFYIVTDGERTLKFPAQFMVKQISLSGMQIETDVSLPIEGRIPMGLSLRDNEEPVNFTGRVVSCQKTGNQEHPHHVFGVEFLELTKKDTQILQTFIEYVSSLQQSRMA